MRPPTLVTGGTGLIGRHVVRRLLAEGRPVRLLVREPGRIDPEVRGRVQVTQGDVRDAHALGSAVQGVHTVLHLAGYARAWSRDPGAFASVNVHAVELLLEAAFDAGVERLVHVSTCLTLPECHPEPAREARRLTPYEETKLLGERLVLSYAAQGRHALIVHPTRVYGPGPLNDANGVTRVVALYLKAPLILRLDDGDVLANYVHAADVAAGIVLAADLGHPAAHYILGGENSSFRGLLNLVGELVGRRRPMLPLPRPAALAVAHAAQLWGRLGGTAAITPDWVRAYFEDQRIDITPTRRELGYAPRPLRQGLKETIAWLRSGSRAAA
ncbi:MAG: NAD-dependent epimerase/dehydratase family protein [Gemmatimonadales bacterium]